jgi:hypothetical protein
MFVRSVTRESIAGVEGVGLDVIRSGIGHQ